MHFTDQSKSYVNAAGVQIDGQNVSIGSFFGPVFRCTRQAGDNTIDLHLRFDLSARIYNQAGPSIGVDFGDEGLGGDRFSARSITGRATIPLN